ncbi:MAG: fatty acid--CoA ligase family protein [Gemmataceae bacterium]|nr:fatty acid--CoA ligase family protein [Gemmataceae bacterium]
MTGSCQTSSCLTWLLERFEQWADREALAGDGWSANYGDLLEGVARWHQAFERAGIGPGHVVAFDGDYGVGTVGLLLALIEHNCIAVPLASAAPGQKQEFADIAQAEYLIDCGGPDPEAAAATGVRPNHVLLTRLIDAGRPGLVLFSSGSTGKSKAMLHDFGRLLEKFQGPAKELRILSFLLLDHIGGINTLFAGLSGGGTVVSVGQRSPQAVCQAIERNRVEILPTTPTFLNLLLLSGEHLRNDLSSLRLITYGTEVMPASTLERLHGAFPGVRFQQTYGLSELGILRSKSREDGSLWVKVGGEGFETKIVDGILWIRARSAMMGYLNAGDCFDADGWFNTQDAVEQDGEWLRFLGRTTDLINVGGQKVYPAQVETVLLEMDNVQDVTVRGEAHPLVGQCVVARVNLVEPQTPADFKAQMRRHCQGRLAPYMVPVKVEIVAGEQYNARGKKIRKM